MITRRQIEEIIGQYEKHGWSLRRVLLSAPTAARLDLSPTTLFGAAEIVAGAALDALWFSRARAGEPGREAWELRHLGGAPFALVEIFEPEEDEAARETIRREMQTRLLEKASKPGGKRSGH